MGFNSVYRGLQDVFPQVDTRILRAVAIENSKDVDRAVEVVLMEVLPYMSKGTTSLDLSNDSQENAHLADSVEDTLQSDSKFLNETAYAGALNGSSYYDANGGGDQVCGSDGKEIISPMDSSTVQAGSNQGSPVLSAISKDDVPSNLDCLVESNLEQLCLNVNPSEAENSVVQLSSSSIHECTLDTPQLDPQNSDHGESEESRSSDAASDKCISDSEMVDFEDESALNTEVTRSGQICRIDLLEDIVEAARNNKKTLFSAMESVISLMREVELQEKAAEQVKEEAVRGGLDILTRVEDLKQMLRHAREANDMHAGEVYGEKAILATEAKELQSRLLSLSDERDKSLAILVEMGQTLEERLDAAEKQRKAAKEEKMEKEELARNALAEQELIMEKVVQESKMLKQEAEENSKLREFLMDRGRVVDILQGEISVICQDVKLLKEKFDERVPLSESLSSSQTSCRLASSSSSLKSLIPDPVPEQTETTFDTPKKTSPTPSVTDQLSSGEEREANDREALLDDEWELFDNNDLNL